jgi:hypothetical protein
VLYICDRFFPSKAKAIGDRVIADVLNGTTYDEDDTKNWSVEISDKIRHEVAGTVEISYCFMPEFTYSTVTESMGPNSRFKIVVQTTMGQMKDQGIRIASRCLWDPTTDNYASCSYKNVSAYADSVSSRYV